MISIKEVIEQALDEMAQSNNDHLHTHASFNAIRDHLVKCIEEYLKKRE